MREQILCVAAGQQRARNDNCKIRMEKYFAPMRLASLPTSA
jgi:hypothetical protein